MIQESSKYVYAVSVSVYAEEMFLAGVKVKSKKIKAVKHIGNPLKLCVSK